VLWDLITYLDQATIDLVRSLGGIRAIVISHPHYYTSWDVWAKAFGAQVYFAVEDEEWLCSSNSLGLAVPIDSAEVEIVKGITAVKVGGHFPGSMMLHYRDRLFTADSVVTTPVCTM
jgi:glyoxylase-like metal-dependent hydrolase (beta-lactamase superfamily II)